MTTIAGIGDGRDFASSASSPPLLSGKRQGSVLKPVPASVSMDVPTLAKRSSACECDIRFERLPGLPNGPLE